MLLTLCHSRLMDTDVVQRELENFIYGDLQSRETPGIFACLQAKYRGSDMFHSY